MIVILGDSWGVGEWGKNNSLLRASNLVDHVGYIRRTDYILLALVINSNQEG